MRRFTAVHFPIRQRSNNTIVFIPVWLSASSRNSSGKPSTAKMMESKVVDGAIQDGKADRAEARLGHFCALTIGSLAILVGGGIAMLNPTLGGAITSSIIGGGGVIGLVTVFILGRKAIPPDQSTGEDSQLSTPKPPPPTG